MSYSIPSATILRLHEVMEKDTECSVRTIGRLCSVDVRAQTALICDPLVHRTRATTAGAYPQPEPSRSVPSSSSSSRLGGTHSSRNRKSSSSSSKSSSSSSKSAKILSSSSSKAETSSSSSSSRGFRSPALLCVDTHLLDPFPYKIDSVFMFLGELIFKNGQRILKARLCRNYDRRDLKVEFDALERRRELLKKRFERIEAFKKGILEKLAEEKQSVDISTDKCRSSSSTSTSSSNSRIPNAGGANKGYFCKVPPYRAKKERAALSAWCNTPTDREAFGIAGATLDDHGSADEDGQRMSDEENAQVAQVQAHRPEAVIPVTASKIPRSGSLGAPNDPGDAEESDPTKVRGSSVPRTRPSSTSSSSLSASTARAHSFSSSSLVTRDRPAHRSHLSVGSADTAAPCESDQAKPRSLSKRVCATDMSDDDDEGVIDDNEVSRSDSYQKAKRARLH